MNDFVYSNELGSRYQDILAHELTKIGICLQCHTSAFFQMNYGESVNGIEVKHDSKIVKTGNIFFEFNAINKKSDKFVDGGIEKEDNAWLYIIGNGKECWVFSKKQLKSLFRKVKSNPELYKEKGIYLRTHFDKDTKQATANGMCVCLGYCEELCINHLVFGKDYTKWLENI